MFEGSEIQGVSPEVRQRFSKRRAEVEAGIAAFEKTKGRTPSVTEIGVITRQTRTEKMPEISTPTVRAAQAAQLSVVERKELQALTRLDCKAAYVACSRGRQSCTVFTPEKEKLFAGLPRSADRRAALDVLRERERDRRIRTTQKVQFVRAGALERAVAAAPRPVAVERPHVPIRTRSRGHDLGLGR